MSATSPADVTSSEGLSVVMYTPSARGGHARYTHELLQGMTRVGSNVHAFLVTSEDLDPSFRSSRFEIAAILPALRPRDAYSSRVVWALARLGHYTARERRFLRWVRAQDPRPDVVHIQEYAPWLARRHYRRIRRLGCRVAVSVHNLAPHDRSRAVRWLVGWLYRRGWSECDAIFVHTASQAAALRCVCRPGARLELVSHPLFNTSPLRGGEQERPHVPLRLAAIGQIRQNKHYELLIESLGHVKVPAELVIAGEPQSDAYLARLRDDTRRYGAGRVKLRPRLLSEHELHSFCTWADVAVFIYDSTFSSASGALQLARAYELPVVVSAAPALAETVRELGDGVVVDPLTPEAVGNAIAAFADPVIYRTHRSASSRTPAVTWDDMASQMLRAYRVVS